MAPDQSVEAGFDCEEFFAGYPGVVHGGVVSAALDAAMTHCLFARGDQAMTAELKVRFRSPAVVGTPAKLRASLVRARGQFLEVCAEFWQDGELRAVSRGKFIRTSAANQVHINP
jgi:acyl-coenzyme A thioesterase PaaI-like protein